MININNVEKFEHIAEVAKNDIFEEGRSWDERKRWTTAIAKAEHLMKTTPEFMEWQDDTLLIWSDSNKIYEANGECQCLAFKADTPCWHRAAAALWKTYLMTDDSITKQCTKCGVNQPEKDSRKCEKCNHDDAIYLKESCRKPVEMVGRIKI